MNKRGKWLFKGALPSFVNAFVRLVTSTTVWNVIILCGSVNSWVLIWDALKCILWCSHL